MKGQKIFATIKYKKKCLTDIKEREKILTDRQTERQTELSDITLCFFVYSKMKIENIE